MPALILLSIKQVTGEIENAGDGRFLKKNQSTPRPSEHPPVMGEKMSKLAL